MLVMMQHSCLSPLLLTTIKLKGIIKIKGNVAVFQRQLAVVVQIQMETVVTPIHAVIEEKIVHIIKVMILSYLLVGAPKLGSQVDRLPAHTLLILSVDNTVSKLNLSSMSMVCKLMLVLHMAVSSSSIFPMVNPTLTQTHSQIHVAQTQAHTLTVNV